MQGSFSKELQTTVALVQEASSLIRKFYRRGVDVDWKGQDDPVTVADRSACELLVKGLSKAFPEDSVLSEELPMLNKGSKRVWCIDPLDGTREFIEGIDEFAVMVGLCVEGRPVLGVVDQPAVGLLFYAEKGAGAWSEQDGRVQALGVSSVASPSQMTLAVSRSHRDPRVEKVMTGLNCSHS